MEGNSEGEGAVEPDVEQPEDQPAEDAPEAATEDQPDAAATEDPDAAEAATEDQPDAPAAQPAGREDQPAAASSSGGIPHSTAEEDRLLYKLQAPDFADALVLAAFRLKNSLLDPATGVLPAQVVGVGFGLGELAADQRHAVLVFLADLAPQPRLS
jgi:uncharacterized membrane protein